QADGTSTTPILGKRKLGADSETEASETASKKNRMSSKATAERCAPKNLSKPGSNTTEHHTPIGSPRGSQWSNNSCAFDAVLSVLYNVWQENAVERTAQFKEI